jgi:ferredoxin
MLQDIIPSVGKTKHSKINLYIFLSSLAILFFGTNLLACFDPFVTFNRLIILFKIKIEAAFIFTIPFILIIILNLYKKRLWCFKLCPLGAFFDWIALLKNKQVVDLNKRKTIIALGSGLILGTLSKGIKPLASSADKQLLRPPGSLPENEFVDRCIRCGSCLGVCLTGTLTPSFFEAGLNGLFTPKLDPIKAECDEYCNKCGTACPTQAIKAMSLEIKRNFKIGTAEINRTKCIAWSENQLCLVCQEFCPYLAITSVKNQNGIPSPAVIDNLCRGCGHCENHCPARPTRAIKIYSTGSGTFIK